MSKITVDLEAFYGYSCGFQGHGSNETIEVEISDDELAALKQIDEAEVSAEAVAQAIEDGDPTLEALPEKLSDAFYNMVEEYWLYEAYNECLDECLSEAIKEDVRDGLYTPVKKEEKEETFDCRFCSAFCDEELDEEEEDAECETTVDRCPLTIDEEDDDWDDEDTAQWDMDDYYAWVCEHDHAFVAERVGLNLDACHDDEVTYTIRIKE